MKSNMRWWTDRLHVAERSGDSKSKTEIGPKATMTDLERCHALKKSGESNAKEAARPRPRDDRPDPQAGRGGYRQAHRLVTERRSAAQPRKMTPVARSPGKAGSAVDSRSRGACALRPRSATSGSTSACGREAGGTLHRHLRETPKARANAVANPLSDF